MDKNKKIGLAIIIVSILVFGVAIYFGYQNTKQKDGALVIVTRSTSTKQDTRVLDDINVSYQLSAADKKLYDISVMSAVQFAEQNGMPVSGNDGDVMVTGRACNGMTSTIAILAPDTTTDKTVIKTLNDGRIVLQPVTMSTLMACPEGNPATDDQALTLVINNIAASLQSL